MPKVHFSAKPGLPADKGGKRWLHRKAGYVPAGKGHRLVEAVYFEPKGGPYEVSQWDLDWLLANGPEGCFKEAVAKSGPKPKSKSLESKESDE